MLHGCTVVRTITKTVRQQIRCHHLLMRAVSCRISGCLPHVNENSSVLSRVNRRSPCSHTLLNFRKFKGNFQTADDELSEDEDNDEEFAEYEEDNMILSSPKQLRIALPSTRADNMIPRCFNEKKSSFTDAFFATKCLHNGKKLKKKSLKMKDGDRLDIIEGESEFTYTVRRIRLLKILEEKTKKGHEKVVLRVWKKPFEMPKKETPKW